MTSQALAYVARRAGVRQEQKRIREAWDKELFAIRSAGSGSGTSTYPKPDYLIFNKDGVIDVVQCKTTRKYHSYFTPLDWKDEVEAARRLQNLGFKVRIWLDFTLFRIGRSASINKWFRIDGHENNFLNVNYDSKNGKVSHEWSSHE